MNFDDYFDESRSKRFINDLENYGKNYNSSEERRKYSKKIIEWLKSSFDFGKNYETKN